MKRYFKIGIVLLLIVLFISSPAFSFVKSLCIMSIYSWSEEGKSLMTTQEFKIDMPGGISTMKKDYFPFVMTFNDSISFSNYVEKSVKLTILYNFGAFEYTKGASSYYNPTSQYSNSFYGAYILKSDGEPYGFNKDGDANFEEISKIAEYDIKVLVLESLGCQNPQFDFSIEKIDRYEEFLGFPDWTVIDANIITNAPIHLYQENHQAYIQYGKPPKAYYEGIDFPLIKQKGRIIGKYFEEKECTIFLYVLAQDEATIEQGFQDFLMKTTLTLE